MNYMMFITSSSLPRGNEPGFWESYLLVIKINFRAIDDGCGGLRRKKGIGKDVEKYFKLGVSILFTCRKLRWLILS